MTTTDRFSHASVWPTIPVGGKVLEDSSQCMESTGAIALAVASLRAVAIVCIVGEGDGADEGGLCRYGAEGSDGNMAASVEHVIPAENYHSQLYMTIAPVNEWSGACRGSGAIERRRKEVSYRRRHR